MGKVFYMEDVRNIFGQLQAGEISMSKALELLNERAGNEIESAFRKGWMAKFDDKKEYNPNSFANMTLLQEGARVVAFEKYKNEMLEGE